MKNSFHALPPIPTASEEDPGSRREVGEFLLEVAEDRLRRLRWSKKFDKPGSEAWRART
jgi:hypothetical protein